ncbi:ATP binding cassette (ABC) transporter subfamily C member, partial [Diabrotica virgifera virgifera]
HKITPGVAGLAILQVFQLMGALQFATQKSLDFVQYLMSIERMIEFSKIEPEEFSETKKNGVYNFQPGYSGAEVVFKNVSMFYNKGSLVLNGINVSIASGEKVGVVGRTGAGKSSLINVLLRLSEFSGSVQINGVDTKTMPLEILRKRVSIIPQDPVLFTNTVRYNLDPFGEFTDDNLWTVIKQVELKDCITSLDSVVTSGGNNFSTGEKQLICLARAILRKNELAILDEATANVDQRTDELIQRTLKMRFANFTLITIAHRLQTIMQTDKVLLMDNGYLVECDHPYRLILKRGKFYDLVQQTGDATAAHLEDMAYKHFTQHHS